MITFRARDEALADYLPHRARNLIIDDIEVEGEDLGRVGRSRVTIEEGGSGGRDIFLQTGPEGGREINEFAMMEHMALTSSVMIFRDIGSGNVAFFSAIKNYARDPSFRCPAGEPLRAEVVPLRGKGAFHRSRALLRAPGGGEGARAEIMAVIMKRDAAGAVDAGKTAEPPAAGAGRAVDPEVFAYKPRAFRFLDEETALDAEAGSLTGRYHYPSDHPFTEGHFPGNPVMMGVTQWAAVLDAALWLHHRRGATQRRFRADGELVREDGSVVCEVKGLSCSWPGPGRCPTVLETRRIGFRDVVRAGSTVYVRVRGVPVDD